MKTSFGLLLYARMHNNDRFVLGLCPGNCRRLLGPGRGLGATTDDEQFMAGGIREVSHEKVFAREGFRPRERGRSESFMAFGACNW